MSVLAFPRSPAAALAPACPTPADYAVVQVAWPLAEEAACRMAANGLRCGRLDRVGEYGRFFVPAGSEWLSWPTAVCYLPGGSLRFAAYDPVTLRASLPYARFVTPPAPLWAVLAALSTAGTPAPPPPMVCATPP